MALPALLGLLGQFAAPAIANYGIGKFNDWMNGPQAQDPNVLAQQGYLQQIQQPINMGTQQRQQQLMNDFQQNILPGIQEQFAGAGGTRSSAFGQQLGSAAGNLATNLGALGEQNAFQNAQLNQNRLGELRGYLGQQQGFGLQGQQLRQQGIGQMLNYQLGQRGHDINQMRSLSDLINNLSKQGTQNVFDTMQHGPQSAGMWSAMQGLAKAAGTGIKAARGQV